MRPLPELGLGHPFLLAMLAATLPLSLAGWLLENPHTYWSSDTAIAVWCGLVPCLTLLTGALWRPRSTRTAGTIAVFVITSLPFVVMVAVRKGRLNDDALGLSALVGGCAAVAFLLGLLLNRWARQFSLKKENNGRS